ncbi:MAG: hypothetical protein ACLGJB_15600 [Blastocatellia bacterium]
MLQESASKENNPHAHCHSDDKVSHERASSHHDSTRSSPPQRRDSDDSPACVSHLYAGALVPRVTCAEASWHAEALTFESPLVALARAADQPADDALATPHRPPPDLAMLSILRI